MKELASVYCKPHCVELCLAAILRIDNIDEGNDEIDVLSTIQKVYFYDDDENGGRNCKRIRQTQYY